MELQVVVKSVLLLLTSLAFYTATTSPTPAAERKDVVYKNQSFEHFIGYVTSYLKYAVLVTSLLHIAVLVLLAQPQLADSDGARILSHICAHPSQPLSQLTPRFVSGVLLLLCSVFLRIWSYRTLGALFTFEVSLKDEHTLVTTGPYAFVRHPSYTTAWMCMYATHLVYCGPTEYLRACGVMETRALWLVYAWRALVLYGSFSVWRRGAVEDGVLKGRFGAAWEEYRRKVPYRFFPYVT